MAKITFVLRWGHTQISNFIGSREWAGSLLTFLEQNKNQEMSPFSPSVLVL